MTYVADWDAKGRSNDEEEPMRSQWTDKATGKVINLSNYAYSKMSGWNGYSEDFNHITGSVSGDITDHILLYMVTSANNVWIWSRNSMASIYNTIASMRIKIIGVSALSGTLRYYYIPDENPTTRYFIDINSDGIYTLPSSVKYTGEGMHNIGFYLINLSEASIGKIIKVEQLPLYPGALVSDGVDDSGITNGVLSETDSVGCVLAMCRFYKDSSQDSEFLCFSGSTNNNVAIYRQPNGTVRGRLGSQNEKIITSTDGIYTLSDSPVLPNRNFLINCSGATDHCASILSRLILIKEQLDDAQQDFLKWKVGKEYRDWCKENGYDYAITEMLNN